MVGWTLGGVVVLAALMAAAVIALTNTTWGRAQVRTRVLAALQSAVHGRVSIGALHGNLLRGVTIDALHLADSAGQPFVDAEQVRIGYALWPLVSRRLDLSDVQLIGARIQLDRSAQGVWNYDRLFPRDTTTSRNAPGFGSWITLRDVTVRRSQLVVRIADDSAVREQRFDTLNGHFPLLRLADPDRATRRIEVDSLRSVVSLATGTVPAQVRQLQGVFELTGDSVWFGNVQAALPASQLTLTGRYTFSSGDLQLVTTGAPAALGDLRFLMPELPTRGEARLTAALQWEGRTQRYAVRALDLVSDSTRIRGALAITLHRDSTPSPRAGTAVGAVERTTEALRFDSLDLAVEALSTALITQLVPNLDMPVSGSLNGRLAMAGIPSALAVRGDVQFTDRRTRARSRVQADGLVGIAEGVVRATALTLTASPVDAQLVRTFVPAIPFGGVYRGHAVVNGRSDRTIEARALTLEHRDGAAVTRLTGRAAATLQRGALFALDVDLVASPLSLVTVGQLAPAAGLQGAVAGPVHLIGPLQALAVDASLRTPDGGQIAARGTLDLASRELGYAVDVRTVLFNAQAVSTRAPRTSLSAVAQARARGIDPATMRGTFTAHLLASRLDTVAVDSLAVKATTAEGLLSIDSLTLFGPATRVAARGTLGLRRDATGTLAWQLRVDSLGALARYLPPADTGAVPARPLRTAERHALRVQDSLREARALAVARAAGAAPPARPLPRDSARSIPRDALAGSLVASGRLEGSLQDLAGRGTIEVRDLFARGQAVSRARASLSWNHVLTDSARFTVAASVDSARLGGFALDSVSIQADHRKSGGSAQVAIYQNSARDYAARADYALYADRQEIRLNDLRLRFDTAQWTAAHPGGIRWGQPGVFVDSLDLRHGADGRVFANGRIPSEGAADLTLLVNRFELGDLLGLAQSDIDGRGELSLNGRVVGTARDPRISAEVALRQIRYQGASVPDVRVRGRYGAERLDVDAELREAMGEAGNRGSDSSRLGESGRVLATVTAALPINLALSEVTGSRLLDRPASGALRADSLPLDVLGRFTDALADLRGAATARVALSGTLRDPRFDGTVRLRDGATRVVPLGLAVSGVHGDLRLTKDTVVLDSLVAWSGGRLALHGGIGLKDIRAPAVDLRLVADHARVLNNEQGRVRADADITARGPFDNVFVSGTTRIREGVLYIPRPDDREVISAGDPAVFAVIDTSDVRTRELVPTQSPLLANLRMDLGLQVDRDTWVRSPEANIEIFSDGELRVLVDRRRQALALDGIVNTDRGEYEFLGKRFQVKRGAVQFIGTQEINPLLQITGEYAVQQPARPALAIRILIGGTLQSPRLTLESDAQPPISQSDLLSYLAFGSEAGSLLQFGGSSLSGGTAGGGLVGTSAALATRQLTGIALGVAVDELEGQAARSLGADVFTITPANLPTELASGNFGALTTFLKGTQFAFGKYVSTRTFLGLQVQATTTPGFRVQHQLSRTPGLSLDATFQPRFFLPEPSLSPQQITKANALGLFLARRWRF
jgi:translocation and assembly module TamB